MGPQRLLRRSTSGPQAGAGRAEGGATGPAVRLPGAWRRRPRRAARPCFAGCLSPAPPRRPDSGPPHPTAGFVHRPRGGPSPFPPAPPRPHPAGPTSSAQAVGAGRGRRDGAAGNCGQASGRGTPWRGWGFRGAAASLPKRRRPRPAPQLRAPLYGANPGSLQLGEQSGGRRRESQAARPAGGALGLRAPFGARLGLRGARESGLLRSPTKLIVRLVRGRPAAGRAAKVGGGRAGGGGRPARARRVVGVSVFFLKTPLGRAGGAFRTPGPAGDVREAAAADAGLRAAPSLQLVSSIVAERDLLEVAEDESSAAAHGRYRDRQGAERPAGLQCDVFPTC
ncbi:uncharacterized protein LOC141570762 [Rhinolophus sinicus]|uniref:uncharacterized protein LOC141570762 n=1 Tax=Rhinolophus sinicus TaxID=89399 RepID=UPI003D7BE5C7